MELCGWESYTHSLVTMCYSEKNARILIWNSPGPYCGFLSSDECLSEICGHACYTRPVIIVMQFLSSYAHQFVYNPRVGRQLSLYGAGICQVRKMEDERNKRVIIGENVYEKRPWDLGWERRK